MDQEKFVNQYIELLNATVSEAIQKNLVIQAQKKIIEAENAEIKEILKNISTEKDREIDSLKSQLNQSRRQEAITGNEKEELKKSIQHVDTFKNELIKARSDIENLLIVIKEKDKELDKLRPKVETKEEPKVKTVTVELEEKPKDVGNTWVKKVPAKKKTSNKDTIIKDAGKF